MKIDKKKTKNFRVCTKPEDQKIFDQAIEKAAI